MVWCDKNAGVLEWGSEEIVIPYISPIDSRRHRYFPDFYIKVKNQYGKIDKYIIEIKPKYQVNGPKPGKRKTKTYINEVKTYAVNQAKWKAAEEYCLDRRWKDSSMQTYTLTIILSLFSGKLLPLPKFDIIIRLIPEL